YDFTSSNTYARARYYKPEFGRFVSEDTYRGDIWNPQSLNLYNYVNNNPLRYVDPTGHQALEKSVEEAMKEFRLIIGGAGKGAKQGKKGGALGTIVGGIIGALFLNATPAGESQQSINQNKAERLNLPLISPEQLEKLNKNNGGFYAYRSINDVDIDMIAAGKGIIAKDPMGTWSAEEHILYGSDEEAWVNDPWLSTTADPTVAFNKYNGNRNGVIVIDLSKIQSNKLYFSILNLKPGTRAYKLAYEDKEILIKYSIPQSAIVGVIFSN
ncbi:RHS repeat-associated core domain-containing protein, partial [Paenibacillus durus]